MDGMEHLHKTDPLGLETLERLAEADNFNRWLFNTVAPYCKGHILEVGSGIGNLSKYFLEKKFTLSASDLRKEYCDILSGRIGNDPNLAGIHSIDLAATGFTERYAHLLQQFDTVIALNVIEHIQDDG